MNVTVKNSVRVRFAPSPTGFMHLGNVRAALVNYLFAAQKSGIFILRIEDTDPQRNVDLNGKQIMADLAWLGLAYQEGPIINGPHAPYYQSERAVIYQNYLTLLQEKGNVYRCFCSPEELEKKRQRQIDLKQPPRYDRACLRLPEDVVQEKLHARVPYIWRLKLPEGTTQITDLARGTVTYDFSHFSDAPLTRQDHSFTFIFANFVDDHAMGITHIFRGEDHLTNTAIQAALYSAFNAPIPLFWHLPIICNAEGKKLSKRDFGFSLTDLREAGYLPEAINNYLAIIGGGSFEQEIMSLSELAQSINFDHITSTGHIRYDLEKLRWINHKWMNKLSPQELALRCHHYLEAAYPEQPIAREKLTELIALIQTDLVTLRDCIDQLAYYFKQPDISQESLIAYEFDTYLPLIQQALADARAGNDLAQALGAHSKAMQKPVKNAYALVRLALTGNPHGPSIKDLIALLGKDEAFKRIENMYATK